MSDVIDTQATEVPSIEQQVLTISMKVERINVLLNALNKPLLTDAVTLAGLIQELHDLCRPQLEALAAKDNAPEA
jgi:hypothetical protein